MKMRMIFMGHPSKRWTAQQLADLLKACHKVISFFPALSSRSNKEAAKGLEEFKAKVSNMTLDDYWRFYRAAHEIDNWLVSPLGNLDLGPIGIGVEDVD